MQRGKQTKMAKFLCSSWLHRSHRACIMCGWRRECEKCQRCLMEPRKEGRLKEGPSVCSMRECIVCVVHDSAEPACMCVCGRSDRRPGVPPLILTVTAFQRALSLSPSCRRNSPLKSEAPKRWVGRDSYGFFIYPTILLLFNYCFNLAVVFVLE